MRSIDERGDERLAEMLLRETAALSALRRQAGALSRRHGPDEALRAHLGRATRRVESLEEALRERGGSPPAALAAAFRLVGWAAGTVTSIGGGERTLRAMAEGANRLAGDYGRRLASPLPPDVAHRLALNYRDVLLLRHWLERKLSGSEPPPGSPPPSVRSPGEDPR